MSALNCLVLKATKFARFAIRANLNLGDANLQVCITKLDVKRLETVPS